MPLLRLLSSSGTWEYLTRIHLIETKQSDSLRGVFSNLETVSGFAGLVVDRYTEQPVLIAQGVSMICKAKTDFVLKSTVLVKSLDSRGSQTVAAQRPSPEGRSTRCLPVQRQGF